MRRDFTIQTFTPEGKDAKTAVITVSGNLSLNNSEGIKKQLNTAIKKHDDIHLEIKNADELDLSFLQILFSLIAYCHEENKKITHTAYLSQEQKQLLEHAGFKTLINIAEKL